MAVDRQRSEWLEALDAYSKRLIDKPTDHLTLCNRSFVLVKLERYDEALEDADRCIASKEDFAKGFLRRGQALEKLGCKSEALGAVIQSLKLDSTDDGAVQLLHKVDDQLRAGLAVTQRLLDDAKDRRNAVRGTLHSVETFQEKWGRLDLETREKLVLRMLAKGLDEIKSVFLEYFHPQNHNTDVLLQREILAAAIVVSSDISNALAIDDEPEMLKYIYAVADNEENAPKFCGDGMASIMASYQFPPFRHHPKSDTISADLIQAQRSTLCLIVTHFLLGGDGLPTATPRRHTNDDDAKAIADFPTLTHNNNHDDDTKSSSDDTEDDYDSDHFEDSSSDEEDPATDDSSRAAASK